MRIPRDRRFPGLRQLLLRYACLLADLGASNPQFASNQGNLLLYLVYPWLADAQGDGGKSAELERRRNEFARLGFDGDVVRTELGAVLAGDTHLRECCPTPMHLAHFLGVHFMAAAVHVIQTNGADAPLGRMFDDFERFAYEQGPFKKIALSHIYNFEAESPSEKFGDLRVERLDTATIAAILGEASFPPFFHPAGVGDHFVVTEEQGPCDDVIPWVFEERNKHIEFVRTLQYFKDGVVHIDYSVPHFLPQWVNQVRKFGVFFIGTPRRFPYAGGRKPYRLEPSELDRLERWWAAYSLPCVSERLADERNKFRQAIMRAGDYYEASQSRAAPAERLVDLAISLESLFSPSDKGELRYRISQSAAQILAEDPTERVSIFNQVREMYDRRSSLVHGSYDVTAYYDGHFVTDDEIDRWASIIRRAILRFLVLYLRGRNNRDDLLGEICQASLDAVVANALREESDPSRFLASLNLGGLAANVPHA